jgi:7-cyano-7-deazaguanine synthase in queuosine biosynthesis
MPEKVAVLYSGGSDSVLAAAVLAKDFEQLHLLTFTYSGIAEGAERSTVNVERLRRKFPDREFVHSIFYQDKLLKTILTHRKLRDFLKYRLFVVAMCPICKITMHTRTLVYCLDHGIKHVADGANQARGRSYPEQVRPVMQQYARFYKPYGIAYTSPIYDMPPRTDHILHEMGIYPYPNVKTDVEANALIEPNCDYKSLYHTVSVGYYKNLYGDDVFEEITIRYYEEKFRWLQGLVDDYLKDREQSPLALLLASGNEDASRGLEELKPRVSETTGAV